MTELESIIRILLSVLVGIVLRDAIWKCDRYTHEKIEKFHCICAAAQKLGKLQWSKHIGDVLKGRRKSAYGFWWCYAETEMAK